MAKPTFSSIAFRHPMPSGAAIFETIGPWEDYATPSRDMRLLIASMFLSSLPEQITRYPELFSLGGRSAEDARRGHREAHERRHPGEKIQFTAAVTAAPGN